MILFTSSGRSVVMRRRVPVQSPYHQLRYDHMSCQRRCTECKVCVCVCVCILCLPVFWHHQHIPLLHAPKWHSSFLFLLLITGLFSLPVLFLFFFFPSWATVGIFHYRTSRPPHETFQITVLSATFGPEFQLPSWGFWGLYCHVQLREKSLLV